MPLVRCRFRRPTATPPAAVSARSRAQDATVSVFPYPGPALTRVTGRRAAAVSRSASRRRRTKPGGRAGGEARSRNRPLNCRSTKLSSRQEGERSMPGPAEPDPSSQPGYRRTIRAHGRCSHTVRGSRAGDTTWDAHVEAMWRRSELADDGDGVRVSGGRRATSERAWRNSAGSGWSPQSLETVLQGPVVDQAELIGMLNRLQGLGVELRGIRQLGKDAADPPATPPTVT